MTVTELVYSKNFSGDFPENYSAHIVPYLPAYRHLKIYGALGTFWMPSRTVKYLRRVLNVQLLNWLFICDAHAIFEPADGASVRTQAAKLGFGSYSHCC
jgi:hypothetical protein